MDWFFSYLTSQVIIIQLIYHEKDLQELAVGEQQIKALGSMDVLLQVLIRLW